MSARLRSTFAIAVVGGIAAFYPWPVAAGPADGVWEGRMSSSPDSSAQGYAVSHQDICGFDSIDFSAILESGRLTASIDNVRTGGKPVTTNVAANGGIELWMRWQSGGRSFDMKLTGRFSDVAFLGSTFGTYQASEGRDPVSWTCRTDMFMARSPLKVSDVVGAKQRLGSNATRDAILASLDKSVNSAGVAPQATAPPSPTVASTTVPPPPVSIPPTVRVTPEPAKPEPTPARPATQPPAAAGNNPPTDDLARQLALMKQLLDSGLIDPAEFERRRGALLDKTFGGATAPAQTLAPLPAAPQGSSTVAARQAPPTAPAPQQVPAIDWGRYHALVIGINDY